MLKEDGEYMSEGLVRNIRCCRTQSVLCQILQNGTVTAVTHYRVGSHHESSVHVRVHGIR